MPPGPERYRAVLDNLDEVVFETDTEGRWTYLNAAWTKITGWGVDESLGHPFLELVHPHEQQRTIEMFQRVVNGPDDYCHHETRYRTADGSYRWIELRASMLFDEQGRYIGNVGTFLDISERRRAEQLLEDNNRLLEMVARADPLDETLGAIAESLARWTGAPVTAMTAPPRHARADAPASCGEITVRAEPGAPAVALRADPRDADGSATCVELPILAPDHDRRLGTVLLHRGSTEAHDRGLLDRLVHLAAIAIRREQLDADARHKALHDPLTGLPNRALVGDRLEQALSMGRRHHRQIALLLLDLDQFKVVNDTFGHGMGDRVLVHAAKRLRSALRDSDTVGRLGGDEFAVVLAEVGDGGDAERVAGHLQKAIREPLRLDGIDFHLDVSIGIVLSSQPHDDPSDLLRFADVAMYRAKRAEAGRVRYDPDVDAENLRGFDLVGRLRQAIADDQLVLHYQPRVALGSERVVGVEGLVRWQHPERGLILPNDFVPMAEMTGAVRPLLRWVVDRALRDSRQWDARGFGGSVAVNISAQSLHDPELPRILGELLDEDARAGGRPRLDLEITEHAIMVDPEAAITAMSRIGDLGVSFLIDDFGTGYSSLTYLKVLPVRGIKIDRSFVRDMDRDERDAFLVRTAIALAHDLRIDVTAEGVESEGVRDLLTDLGCDCAQGFYFAHPMPGKDVARWLADEAASSDAR